jgi:hypothetical protein
MHPQKTLLQVLFPKARAEIFRLLFGSNRRPRYVRELMGDSGLALRSIQDELRTLSTVAIVASQTIGIRRFFAANPAHPLFREIRRIAEASERLPGVRRTRLFRASRANNRKAKRAGTPMRYRSELSWGILSKPRAKS